MRGRSKAAAAGRSGSDRNLIRNGALMAALLLAAMIGLSGCNTVEGMGQDVVKAGDTVSDTARDVKRKM